MKNNWQKDIHDRLGNYEKDAPKGLWEEIRKGTTDENGGYMHGGRPFKTYWLRRTAYTAAAASVALLIGYSIYSEYANDGQTPSEMTNLQIAHTPAEPSPKGNIVADDGNNPIACNSPVPRIITTIVHKSVGDINTLSSYANDEKSLETASDNHEGDDTNSSKETNATAGKENLPKRENESKKANNYHHNSNYGSLVAYNSDARLHASSSTSPRWTVSASAMGSMGSSRTITSIGAPVVTTGPDDSDWEDNPMLGINIFNQGKEVKTEYKHRLPVRIGVKVAYTLNEHWSIESGLTYTRLSSDMKDGTKENYFMGEQRLNYVGIPVNMKYNAWSYKRFNLYGSAGVLVEKSISGNVTKEYVINNAIKEKETVNIDSKPLQMSVNAAFGVQFDVLDNVGIYAEPGVSYHLGDHSSLQTIYKEKPLNFNLNVGVRYTIGK